MNGAYPRERGLLLGRHVTTILQLAPFDLVDAGVSGRGETRAQVSPLPARAGTRALVLHLVHALPRERGHFRRRVGPDRAGHRAAVERGRAVVLGEMRPRRGRLAEEDDAAEFAVGAFAKLSFEFFLHDGGRERGAEW